MPMLGVFSDRCQCGKRFWGRSGPRYDRYELHWHREHVLTEAGGVVSQADVQSGVTHLRAMRLGYRIKPDGRLCRDWTAW